MGMPLSIRSIVLSTWMLAACSGGGAPHDAATPDDAARDGAVRDDAAEPDAGADADGHPDAAPPEAGLPDATLPDAEVPDAGVPDAEMPDAGVPDADVPDADVPPAPCVSVVGEATLCLGEASGRPGDRVSIPVHILLPPGCPHTTQVGTAIAPPIDVGAFVARPLAQCWVVAPTQTGANFTYLSQSATPMCPARLFAGELAYVELDIAADTPPGDYALPLANTNLGDNSADTSGGCRGDGAIAGRLTVRP